MPKKNEQLHTSVIFEIDSASIAVSVIGYDIDKKFPQREYFSERLALDTHLPFDAFFAHTIKTLSKLASESLINSPQQVDSIYLSLSNPWMSSQKKETVYKNDEAFTVTEDLVSKIINHELQEPLSKNLDFHRDHENIEIFERRTVDIYINGYPSLKPFTDKKVKEVSIHSLTSVLSTVTKDAFVHAIERVFHRQPNLISNTFVLYQATKTFLPDENNLTIIDVGGTNTQMYVVYNDHLKHIASFPVGRQHMVQEVSESLSVSLDKASATMKLFMQKNIDEEYRDQLSKVMINAYKLWLRECYNVCDKLSAKKLLPSTLCLIAPSDISQWLRFHILETEELKEHLHTQKAIQVIDLPYLLQVKADELKSAHITDTEMLPVIDLVGHLLTQHDEYEKK